VSRSMIDGYIGHLCSIRPSPIDGAEGDPAMGRGSPTHDSGVFSNGMDGHSFVTMRGVGTPYTTSW
jgi:hypothetical protein